MNPAVAQHIFLTKAPVLFFVPSPYRKSERFEATRDEVNVFLKPCLPHSSIQVCPTSTLIAPCRGIRSSRSSKSREPRWSRFPSEACLAFQTSAAHLAAGTKFMTAAPQTCPRLRPPAPHQSRGQAEFSLSISPSEPTGWHHQLLVVQNHHQLRNTEVVPSREILTLFSLFCLKKPPPQTKAGVMGGRNREVKEAVIPLMMKLLFFCIFTYGLKHPVMISYSLSE